MLKYNIKSSSSRYSNKPRNYNNFLIFNRKFLIGNLIFFMNNLGVSLKDYQSGNYDGQAVFDDSTSQEELDNLNKALNAGQITGRETTNSTTASGAPLKVESLENTLKVITFKESDIAFWKRIPKLPAYNTVEEYNQLASYGSESGAFTSEGELPQEENSVYIRKAEIVKFLGVTKSVSHPMQLVKTNVSSVVQLEVKNGTLFLLRKADRALAFGDAKNVPQEFNGLYAQQRNSFSDLTSYFSSESVIDLRGKILKEKSIENGALSVISNFGHADLLMAPPVVLSDFVENFYGNKFIPVGTEAIKNGTMGQRVQKFQSQYGEIELGYDLFLGNPPPKFSTDSATNSSAPNTPSAGTVAVTGSADPLSQFDATSVGAGDYFYAVSLKNRFGESALFALNSGNLLTVASGKSVDISYTVSGGTFAPTSVVVYRSEKNPLTSLTQTKLFPIFEVSLAEVAVGYDGATAGYLRDRNRFIPNTQQAFLLQNDEECYSFKQLAPLMKMDLAVLSPATRFMILMYGTPQLYAPRKLVRYINIGRSL